MPWINPNIDGRELIAIGEGSIFRQLAEAYEERRAARVSVYDVSEPGEGDPLLVAKADPASVVSPYSFIRRLQNRIEVRLVGTSSWVDHEAQIAGEVDFPLIDLARMRELAGLPSGGFRRAIEINAGEPVWADPGRFREGDALGPWLIEDLQAALGALKWTRAGNYSTWSVERRRGNALFRDSALEAVNDGRDAWNDPQWEASVGASRVPRRYSRLWHPDPSWSIVNEAYRTRWVARPRLASPALEAMDCWLLPAAQDEDTTLDAAPWNGDVWNLIASFAPEALEEVSWNGDAWATPYISPGDEYPYDALAMDPAGDQRGSAEEAPPSERRIVFRWNFTHPGDGP